MKRRNNAAKNIHSKFSREDTKGPVKDDETVFEYIPNKFSSSQPTLKTLKSMTLYEYTSLVSLRALQLSYGRPPVIDLSYDDPEWVCYNPIAIAQREFLEAPEKLALGVKRLLHTGKVEELKISEMLLPPL